jgi:hypothetical protein
LGLSTRVEITFGGRTRRAWLLNKPHRTDRSDFRQGGIQVPPQRNERARSGGTSARAPAEHKQQKKPKDQNNSDKRNRGDVSVASATVAQGQDSEPRRIGTPGTSVVDEIEEAVVAGVDSESLLLLAKLSQRDAAKYARKYPDWRIQLSLSAVIAYLRTGKRIRNSLPALVVRAITEGWRPGEDDQHRMHSSSPDNRKVSRPANVAGRLNGGDTDPAVEVQQVNKTIEGLSDERFQELFQEISRHTGLPQKAFKNPRQSMLVKTLICGLLRKQSLAQSAPAEPIHSTVQQAIFKLARPDGPASSPNGATRKREDDGPTLFGNPITPTTSS